MSQPRSHRPGPGALPLRRAWPAPVRTRYDAPEESGKPAPLPQRGA